MHPRLEQWGELKIKGKSMRDLEAEYRAVQDPSEFSKKKGDQKPSFHPASGSPRKVKPPTDPETLRQALEADRAAEAAMRNAPGRFDQDPRYPIDTPIRMVTNPWLSARMSEQYPVVQGNLQSPTEPLYNQPGRGWLNHQQPNHQQSQRQQSKQQQPKQQQPKQQQPKQQQPKQQQPKQQNSKAQQSKPGPSKPQQACNNSSHGQKSGKSQPKNNQPKTRQNDQRPQNHAANGHPSDGQHTEIIFKSPGRENKSNNRHQGGDSLTPRKKRDKERFLKLRQRRKEKTRQNRNKKEIEKVRPGEEQTTAAQNPSEQNEGGQPTNPIANRPLPVKEESDTEQLSSLSARFQPMTTDDNPETSTGVRADDAPRRWDNHPLPTEARVGEQHGSISTSFEARPFPRSPSYGTCAFESPPPLRESNQASQPIDHGAPTLTSAPGEVPPETSALARAIAQEMTDKLHAVHLSITDQFQAQNKEIVDRLEKQSTKQKRRMAKLKKKNKVLADKVDKQTEMLKRQKTWMKKRSRKAVAAASIEERPRPSRATEEWEYIHAPIVGYSDDSTDETYVLSSTDEEEEESDVLFTIDEEEEEDEEEEDTDTNDEADSEADSEDELPTGSMARHAEDDILPSVESGSESGSGSDESGTDEPPTPPRKVKRGRAGEATEQSTGPRPAKKRRHGKAKETPVVNPYLERIAQEREQAEFGVFRVGKCRCFRC